MPDEDVTSQELGHRPTSPHPDDQAAPSAASPLPNSDGKRHSLPLDFLLPSLWSSNTSAASLGEPEPEQIATAQPSRNGSTSALRAAALRRLNGPPKLRHRQSRSVGGPPKSSFSQPVLVRTYSKAAKLDSRHGVPAIEEEDEMNNVDLPPLEAFSFNGILKAIDPEISSTLDAIASICAKSRYSLSNQYEVHMPPHAEHGVIHHGQEDRSRDVAELSMDQWSIDAATAEGRSPFPANSMTPQKSDPLSDSAHNKAPTSLFSGFATLAMHQVSSNSTGLSTQPAPQVVSEVQLAVSSKDPREDEPVKPDSIKRSTRRSEDAAQTADHGRRSSVFGSLASWFPWLGGSNDPNADTQSATTSATMVDETAETSLRGLLQDDDRA